MNSAAESGIDTHPRFKPHSRWRRGSRDNGEVASWLILAAGLALAAVAAASGLGIIIAGLVGSVGEAAGQPVSVETTEATSSGTTSSGGATSSGDASSSGGTTSSGDATSSGDPTSSGGTTSSGDATSSGGSASSSGTDPSPGTGAILTSPSDDTEQDAGNDDDGDGAVEPPAGRPDLDSIIDDYQVVDDAGGMVEGHSPNTPGPDFLVENWTTIDRPITRTEADILDEIGFRNVRKMKEARDKASSAAEERASTLTPQEQAQSLEDGHSDAFRHAYWNALMVKKVGLETAEAFATAHEGVPGNWAGKEAMDLYNNQVGRDIAVANPDASDEELAVLVEEALTNGELVVHGTNGELAWSDTIPDGQTGNIGQGTLPGVIDTPNPDGGY